ncbi:MAG: hypothetical protein ACFFDY_09575 [Candidatus Thorarchaeota archaeon]
MKNYIFKILLIGNGGAGKTSLLRRYVDGFFDESTIHLKNTFNMIDYIKTSAETGYNVVPAFEILTKKLVNLSKY